MVNVCDKSKLYRIHKYLMKRGFPYHSVSVVYRRLDLGYHVIFMEDQREFVDGDVLKQLKFENFSHSFIKES